MRHFLIYYWAIAGLIIVIGGIAYKRPSQFFLAAICFALCVMNVLIVLKKIN